MRKRSGGTAHQGSLPVNNRRRVGPFASFASFALTTTRACSTRILCSDTTSKQRRVLKRRATFTIRTELSDKSTLDPSAFVAAFTPLLLSRSAKHIQTTHIHCTMRSTPVRCITRIIGDRNIREPREPRNTTEHNLSHARVASDSIETKHLWRETARSRARHPLSQSHMIGSHNHTHIAIVCGGYTLALTPPCSNELHPCLVMPAATAVCDTRQTKAGAREHGSEGGRGRCKAKQDKEPTSLPTDRVTFNCAGEQLSLLVSLLSFRKKTRRNTERFAQHRPFGGGCTCTRQRQRSDSAAIIARAVAVCACMLCVL